jgi:integrase
MPEFSGFDDPIDRRVWLEIVQIPERIYSLDGQRLVAVDLDEMVVPSDGTGKVTLRFNGTLAAFSDMTRATASYVILDALDGKRKSSTVDGWLGQLGLFGRTVSEAMKGQKIKTITLKMYLWYCRQKSASQEKLLRGCLLRWKDELAPGLHPDLATHLSTTAPPKPRGMIELQNAVPSERPLSAPQVHRLLNGIEDLYASGRYSAQDNLLWRLMISEALRPSQLGLLQFKDAEILRDAEGRMVAVRLHTPIVKQSGISARKYMRWHRLTSGVSQAIVDHIEYVESIHGGAVPGTWALFCVRKSPAGAFVQKSSILIHSLISRTRRPLSALTEEFEDTDLFNRRFKHTKLTHLASAGAPLQVLAVAGFQTSTISLQRYVNLTEEAFAGYEKLLEPTHEQIENAFRGKVIDRSEATHQDPEHRIAAPSMDDDVGACGATPCEALFCLACYGCSKFEAFSDGPHELVEAKLVEDQERARKAGMPMDTVNLTADLLASVRHVIRIIKV